MENEGKKRKLEEISVEELVPKLDTCVNCECEFDHNENDGEIDPCEYHLGEKRLNEDAEIWEEYKEWSTGPMEDTIDMYEYGSGWQWTCCKGEGNWGCCVPHKGKKYPEGLAALPKRESADEGGPDSKHQKVDESAGKSSNTVINLVDETAAPKAVAKGEVKVPSKTPEVITLSDSSDAEEKSEDENKDEEEDEEPENIETCTVCGNEYDGDDGDQECLSHDETLVILEDCPLSELEKEKLDEEKNPEWFVWSCCGEPADDEGCRQYNYHCPDRGMGY